MSMKGELPMNRRSVTVVVVVVLCAVGFAYGQGWLDWSRPDTDVDSKVSASQTLDQASLKQDAVQVAEQSSEATSLPASGAGAR